MDKVPRLLICTVILLSILGTAFGQSSGPESRFQFIIGPSVGLTCVIDPKGELNDRLQEMYPNPDRTYYPFFTQFGLNLEQRLRLGSTESHFAFQELFLVGGMDQGVFLPSFDFLLGFRSRRGLQFGLGPNLAVRWSETELEFALSVVYAVGWNFTFFGAWVPVSLAVVPTPADGMPRISIISGFNFETTKKKKE
jgi:hypothetical protein